MADPSDLHLRMYLTIGVVFAIAFAIIYMVMVYLGFGIGPIIAIALVFFLLQWYAGPMILQWTSHMRYIGADEYPKLHTLVEELAKGAGVKVPRIAIVPRQDPNAFVFGRTVGTSTLAVHEGLLGMVNDDELRAVLAHEIGHLKHSDVVAMTLISFLPLLVYMIAQNLMWGGRGSNKNNGGALVLIGIGAFVAYFFLQFVTLMLSKMRETYADDYSAHYTGRPEDLATSLLKITGNNYTSGSQSAAATTAARAFCIVDPISSNKDIKQIAEHMDEIKALLPGIDINRFIADAQKSGKGGARIFGAVSTHPSTYQRILYLAKLKKNMTWNSVGKKPK